MNSLNYTKIIFLWLLFLAQPVRAEYRVYQYGIIAKDQSQTIVNATLDPVSYTAYHGGQNNVRISLLRTWICPGYTGKKELCNSPYKRLLESDKIKVDE